MPGPGVACVETPPRRLLLQAICILLECIFVCFSFYFILFYFFGCIVLTCFSFFLCVFIKYFKLFFRFSLTEFGWYFGVQTHYNVNPTHQLPYLSLKLNSATTSARNIATFCDCEVPRLVYNCFQKKTYYRCKIFIN